MRFTFGPFSLDATRFELRRDGQPVRLQPKAFQILVLLVSQHERVLTKDELFAACWPGRDVSDAALNTAVKAIRSALGDTGRDQRWIQTVHTHGYRFIGAVVEGDATVGEAAAALQGLSLPAAPSPVPPASPDGAPQREHKHVSVLCCALPDAVERAGEVDAEEMDALMRAFQARVDEVVGRYGGTVLNRLDDGSTALFGAPVAHEDHARRAVLAALELAAPGAGGSARAAVGLHSGPVVVGSLPGEPDRLYVASSETVRLARCLLGVAAPGELLASEATVGPLRAELQAERLRDRGLAGWRVLDVHALRSGVPQSEARFRTPFVGRERECALLHERLDDAREGRGQVLAIVGEPGIGKSRLLREFRLGLSGEPVLEAHCLPYASVTPYRPVLELLRQLAGIGPDDDPAAAAGQVVALLARAGLDTPEALALLRAWLGGPAEPAALSHLSPQAQRERALDLTCELVLHAHPQAPAVVLVEDLHWVDGASEEWLARLARRVAGAPLLLALTYRPEWRPDWLDAPWITRLVLPPLTRQASLHLMRSTTTPDRLSTAVAADIAVRAAGNPFFLEELSRALDGSGAAPQAPGTVLDVLAARIDRLAPADKRLLQVAAVIGQPLALALWQAVAELPAEPLQAALERLQQAGFLYETRGEAGRSAVFKHALTQEVAYRSLLRSVRQPLHERTARVLQRDFPVIAAAQPELLARHYAEAGALREAAEWWQRAGRSAYERSANALAVQQAREGLRALEELPQDRARDELELRLQLTLGPALMAARGYADAGLRTAWERALGLCDALGDGVAKFKALIGLWNWQWVRGEIPQAVATARRLVALAEESGDAALRLRAHAAIGETLFHRGEHVLALQHLERGIAVAGEMRRPSLASNASTVICLSYTAWTRWHLGQAESAWGPAERALALARGLSHPLSLAVVLSLRAGLFHFVDDVEATRRCAAEAVALCHEQGFPFWEGTALVLLGWAQARGGDVDEGLDTIAHGLSVFRATGARVQLSAWHRLQAEALALAGRTGEAATALEDALACATQTGERYVEPDVHRLQSQLLRTCGEAAAAEDRARQALSLAHEQAAEGLSLRIAVELAAQCRDAGRLEAARAVLAPWGEVSRAGPGSADLLRLQALRHELG